jgi:hypothetical protein
MNLIMAPPPPMPSDPYGEKKKVEFERAGIGPQPGQEEFYRCAPMRARCAHPVCASPCAHHGTRTPRALHAAVSVCARSRWWGGVGGGAAAALRLRLRAADVRTCARARSRREDNWPGRGYLVRYVGEAIHKAQETMYNIRTDMLIERRVIGRILGKGGRDLEALQLCTGAQVFIIDK